MQRARKMHLLWVSHLLGCVLEWYSCPCSCKFSLTLTSVTHSLNSSCTAEVHWWWWGLQLRNIIEPTLGYAMWSYLCSNSHKLSLYINARSTRFYIFSWYEQESMIILKLLNCSKVLSFHNLWAGYLIGYNKLNRQHKPKTWRKRGFPSLYHQ